MAGYSHTSLVQKLGLSKPAQKAILHAPEGYGQRLSTTFSTTLSGTLDWVQAFYTDKDKLADEFPTLKQHLAPTGQLWISWPKRTAKLATDLNENIVRDIGLKNGLVDVKVAAIDESWSGLKFVYRLKDR